MPFNPVHTNVCPLCHKKLKHNFNYSKCLFNDHYSLFFTTQLHYIQIRIGNFNLFYYNNPIRTLLYKLIHSDVTEDKWSFLFKVDDLFEIDFNNPQKTIDRI